MSHPILYRSPRPFPPLDLDAGWYVISEVRAPSGYVPDYTPREIEVVPGETAVITINNNRDPSLTIRKIDEQTLTGIEGVTLRITKEGAAEYRDVVTGISGHPRIEQNKDNRVCRRRMERYEFSASRRNGNAGRDTDRRDKLCGG